MSIKRFALNHSPVALYDFSSRSLDDYSGHNYHLSGSYTFREVSPQAFELAPGSNVYRPSHDPELAITGDVTIEVTGRYHLNPSTTQTFVSFTATGETEPTNTLYQLGSRNQHRLRWLHEYGGSGTDAEFLSNGADESLPAVGSDFYAAAVRKDGVVRLYLNGRQHGFTSSAFLPASGGSSAVLRVMLGSTAAGIRGVKITPSALSPLDIAQSYEHVMGEVYGPPVLTGKLWVGALTDTSAVVTARMSGATSALSLLVNGVPSAPVATDADNVARFELTGLTPDTEYVYEIPGGVSGRFHTIAAGSGDPVSFSVAFSGDNVASSTHTVFQAILETQPIMFIHLGDMGYPDISTNSPELFHDNYDVLFGSDVQHRLYRNIPTVHIWDDHDYGPNNSDGTSLSKPAAALVYRIREPHYPLSHTTAIYQTWDVGRVRFIATDQRSEADPNSTPAGPAKTMLGATQKTWFKGLIENSPGKLIVWVCTRWFGNADHPDSWNNFAHERAEICDHFKAHAHGRVIVISADIHYVGIDDGTNVDHATGGGEPLPTFQAAPLDKTVSALSGVWTHGNYNGNGQFGKMSVLDTGGSSVQVTWQALNSSGTILTSHVLNPVI